MKRVTGGSATPEPEPSLAARVLSEGLESVTGAVQSALDVATRHAQLAGKRPDGRSSRWAEHRAARRTELIDAAITAITQHGASVGMDQIAAAAKTSKPVIYRYFADKTDLYRAVSQRVVGDTLTTLAQVIEGCPPPRELLHAGVNTFLVLLEDSPELYRFVSQNPLVGTLDQAGCADFSSVVTDLLTPRLAAHLGEAGLDPALARPWADGIVGFISSASLWWLDHRDAMTRRQLADYLSALLWGGAAGIYQAAGQDVDARPDTDVFGTLPD